MPHLAASSWNQAISSCKAAKSPSTIKQIPINLAQKLKQRATCYWGNTNASTDKPPLEQIKVDGAAPNDEDERVPCSGSVQVVVLPWPCGGRPLLHRQRLPGLHIPVNVHGFSRCFGSHNKVHVFMMYSL
ncbi:hypothetical protein MLD38_020570 [Melastoma candidum]|uniref:Uncharacterized protein n=1 Tax=Melastoma candidum TaxID=119954 RepID=A0ACB9QDP7_9MYRT|nr:hypothetical protein MLD38_020570 [Melastoma candidum]